MSEPKDKSKWYMRRALRLAKKGRGWTLPNPMVGAVIVKDEEIIGDGYHEKFGSKHAEIVALENCKTSPKNAALFVTLEPCCHTGKTPPCTKAIIESGIKKVVIASLDPSEKVAGKGVEELKAAGIEVEVGLLEEKAKEINKKFFTFHEKKRPFITLKMAMSLDGKIAAERGKQTWLTGEKARERTHIMRHNHQAILVGGGTVISDDPHLGVRLIEGRDPLRVILEGETEIPKSAKIFRDENHLLIKNKSIEEILQILHGKDVTSVLVEGGHEVFTKFLKSKLVDEIKIFIAPVILGESALPFAKISDRISLSLSSVRKLGPDALITATPKWDSHNG